MSEQPASKKFRVLSLDQIKPNPDQPRKSFDEKALKELSTSIQEHGVIQPIAVAKQEDGSFLLVAGERRFKAAEKAGLTEIPTILVDGDPAEIGLIENIQRQDLTPIELAEGINSLIVAQGYGQKDAAKALGKSESTVSEILSLNKLTSEIRDKLRANHSVRMRLLVELAKHDQKGQKKLFKKIEKQGLNSEQVRELTRKKGKNRQKSVIVSEISGRALKAMGDLDVTDIGEEQRQNLLESLSKLAGKISALLEQLNAAQESEGAQISDQE